MKLNDSNLFRQQALINGEWLDANNGEVIDVTNPANGDKLGSVPKMGADETRAAIDAANRALPVWRALTAKERANILRNWFNLMMEHQDDLARLMTLEQGKYSAAIFLIPICISFDTAEKRRYATYLILNRRFSFEF